MIIIIGGGITGLYIGYMLFKNNILDFKILEKNDNTGGKIYTDKTESGNLEAGASIFHRNQHYLMDLIRDLNLENKIIDIPNGDALTVHSKYGIIKDGYNIAQLVLTNLLKHNKDKNISVENLIKKLKPKETEFLQWAIPNFEEIKLMNATVYYKSLSDEYDYISCIEGGLSQMIEKLSDILKNFIETNSNVINISKNSSNYILDVKSRGISKKIIADKIVLCTSAPQIKEINYDINNLDKILDRLINVETIRVYVEFNTSQEWLQKYSYIISDLHFRWCIKLTDKLAMISYCDGSDATYLMNLGKNRGIQLIIDELNHVLKINLTNTDIKHIYWYPWSDSYVVWKSDTDCKFIEGAYNVDKNLYQTFAPDTPRCGQDMAWIEAHLQTANRTIKDLLK